MKRIVLLALMLGGCIDPSATAIQVFPKYKGRPVELVMARWGPPEQALKMGDDTLYTWSSKRTYYYSETKTTTGFIGNTPVTLDTPVSGADTLSCRYNARVDSRGLVKDIGFGGANGECDRVLAQLR